MKAWRKACFQQRAMAPEPWDIAWADTGCGCPIVAAIAPILGGFDDALLVKPQDRGRISLLETLYHPRGGRQGNNKNTNIEQGFC